MKAVGGDFDFGNATAPQKRPASPTGDGVNSRRPLRRAKHEVKKDAGLLSDRGGTPDRTCKCANDGEGGRADDEKSVDLNVGHYISSPSAAARTETRRD